MNGSAWGLVVAFPVAIAWVAACLWPLIRERQSTTHQGRHRHVGKASELERTTELGGGAAQSTHVLPAGQERPVQGGRPEGALRPVALLRRAHSAVTTTRRFGLLIVVVCVPVLAVILLLSDASVRLPSGPVVTPQTYGAPSHG